MRVHVTSLNETSFLGVDLHCWSVRDTSNGYLASGGVIPVGTKGGTFDFEIMVRATNVLRFVNGIVFLSPTGDWSNHTFVAATELIPVTSGRTGEELPMARLRVRELTEGRGRNSPQSSQIVPVLTGVSLLAASAIALMVFLVVPKPPEASSRGRRGWLVLSLTLALACIWELSRLEQWVGTHSRALAHAEDLYYPRAWFQKGMLSLTVAASLVFLSYLWRKRGTYQLALFFFSLYLALSTVNLISFHSIDEYTGISWRGVTLVEALKFLCAVATLIGVFQMKWSEHPGHASQTTR